MIIPLCLNLFYFKEAESLLKLVLPEELHPAIVEIAIYLIESFGNSTRIDYGTGMLFYFNSLTFFSVLMFCAIIYFYIYLCDKAK